MSIQPPQEPQPASNDRGVIAEHYHALQSLSSIEAARAAQRFAPATDRAVLLTLLQCVEIAEYNVADLTRRASVDLREGGLAAAATKLGWLRGFHRVLLRLSLAARRRAAGLGDASSPTWDPSGTPAYFEMVPALKEFDAALREVSSHVDLVSLLGSGTLEDPACVTLHCSRIVNQDLRSWTANLATLPHVAPGVDVAELLATEHLRNAVDEHQLRGDTFFTQFRALHQIPELIALEINDRIEAAVRHVRDADLEAALAALTGATDLIDPVESSLPPIVDNLSTFDYHQIRENLGLTSGSHSVSLRFHLFTELYEQLCDAVADQPSAGFLAEHIERQVVALGAFVFAWRDMHLHLPRNNLGGSETKSLTGAPDAVRTVRKMRDNAASSDPLSRLASAAAAATTHDGPLAGYLDGPESSDALLLAATGAATQAHFVDVQNRSGFFAQRCPFSRPPRRVVR